MINESLKDEIKSRVSITKVMELEAIDFKHKGNGQVVCNCPFHDDSRPSLHVTNDTLYKCFSGGNEGCRGGDVFDFYMNLKSISFPEAIRSLAKLAGINLSKENVSSSKNQMSNLIFEVMTQALKLPSGTSIINLDKSAKLTIESAIRSLPKQTINSLINTGYIDEHYKLAFHDNARLEIRNTSYNDVKIVDCNSGSNTKEFAEYKIMHQDSYNTNEISINLMGEEFSPDSELVVSIKALGSFSNLVNHIKRYLNNDTKVKIFGDQNTELKKLAREFVQKKLSSEKILINQKPIIDFLEQISSTNLKETSNKNTYRYMSQIMFEGKSSIPRALALENATTDNVRRIAFLENRVDSLNSDELPKDLFSSKLIELLKQFHQIDVGHNLKLSTPSGATHDTR